MPTSMLTKTVIHCVVLRMISFGLFWTFIGHIAIACVDKIKDTNETIDRKRVVTSYEIKFSPTLFSNDVPREKRLCLFDEGYLQVVESLSAVPSNWQLSLSGDTGQTQFYAMVEAFGPYLVHPDLTIYTSKVIQVPAYVCALFFAVPQHRLHPVYEPVAVTSNCIAIPEEFETAKSKKEKNNLKNRIHDVADDEVVHELIIDTISSQIIRPALSGLNVIGTLRSQSDDVPLGDCQVPFQ